MQLNCRGHFLQAQSRTLTATIRKYGANLADHTYVSLQRRFIDIGALSDPDDDHLSGFRSTARGEANGKPWDQISPNDASIILGTAGSGKTTEVLEAAKRLRQGGTPAFVLRLEALCKQPVEQSFSHLDIDGEAAFKQWRGRGAAVAFLDALDEARLPDARNGSVLIDAFARLRNAVGSYGQELKIVITTRASEWHGANDLSIVKNFIKGLRGNPTPEIVPSVSVYRLAPLSQADVELLAASRLGDTAEFLKAIEKTRAGNLVSQPFEVQILIDAWLYELERGTPLDQVFASRLDLFETAISARLQTEQNQERRSNLDPVGARNACEKLAAAVLLTGIRDLSVQSDMPLAVHALGVLANDSDPWTDTLVRQLLSSSLFQPSIAGKVRFAHRELQDFLAAKFFDRQMGNNAGSYDVIQPLFAEFHGKVFAPQETEHVLGWLATLNRSARITLIDVRPSLLIETGDPLRLSVEERSAALEAHVALYSDRRYRGEWFSVDDVTKFASPELAPSVAKLLGASKSPEVREFLVETARYGLMTSLTSTLVSIALDPTEALRVKAEACQALHDFHDSVHAEQVFRESLLVAPPDDIHGAPSWNEFQISALQYAFPQHATLIDAITAIARLRREASNYTSMTSIRLEEFAASISDADMADWLSILLRFSAGERLEGKDWLPEVKPQFRLASSLISRLVIRMLRRVDWRDHILLLLDALEYLSNRDSEVSIIRSPDGELRDLFIPNTELKRALIDRRLKLFPVPEGKRVRIDWVIDGIDLGEVNFKKVPVFTSADVSSFAADILSAQSAHERLIAFEIAEDIAYRLHPSETQDSVRILQRVVRKSGDTRLRARMPGRARRWLRRRWQVFRHSQFYRIQAKISSRLDRFWGLRTKFRNWVALLRQRKSLQSGNATRLLVWAVECAPNNLGEGAVNFVRTHYGNWVASWFSEGYRKFWRQHSLPGDKRNSYLAYVGLSGLAIDARSGPITGSDTEVTNALEYGLCNLNSVPDWFADLAKSNNAIFKDVARRAIADEFATASAESPQPSEFFRKIVDSDPTLRNSIASFLHAQLRAGSVSGRANRELALRVIALSETIAKTTAADFLEDGLDAALTSFDFGTAWNWMDALLLVDGTRAWNRLVAFLGDDWGISASTIFKDFLGREGQHGGRSERGTEDRNDLARNSFALARLVRATHLTWPPARDPAHERVYSPGPDDRRSEKRRYYINALARTGEPALKEFEWLTTRPDLRLHWDSFKYEMDQMARNMARRPIFDVPQTIVFLNEFSKEPQTIVEFRNLVRRHLRALLNQLHLSDADESYVFRRGDATEDDLRNWLAGRMREMGDRYYSIVREQEVAKENRPDLRVEARNPKLGNVSVEIKLADADHWPGRVLKDKLKTQLADQYMHEWKSHSGIYLLANAAKPKVAEYDKKGKLLRKAFAKKIGTKTYTFAALIEFLEADAKLLCSDERFVEVMGIDLSERN